MRFHHDHLQAHEVMVFADELDIHLLPQVGAAWMLQGTQAEVMTPGKNEKHFLAGAWHLTTGKMFYCLGARKNHGWFRDLFTLVDRTSPTSQLTRISVVVDNGCMHKAKAVEQWLAHHPRFALLWVPRRTVHGPISLSVRSAMCMTGAHETIKRKRLRDLVQDVERHVQEHGPWQYKLSHLYDAPEVTAAVENIAAEQQTKIAA